MEKLCKLVDYAFADDEYQEDLNKYTMLECTFISEDGETFNILVKVKRNSNIDNLRMIRLPEDIIAEQIIYKN